MRSLPIPKRAIRELSIAASVPLNTTISPDPNSVTSYFINAVTRSKSIIEVIQVRHIESPDQWQFSYEVKELLSTGLGVPDKTKVLEVTEPFGKLSLSRRSRKNNKH